MQWDWEVEWEWGSTSRSRKVALYPFALQTPGTPCHRPSLSLSPFLSLVLTLFKRITLRHSMYEGDGTGPIVEDALRWLERESI